MDKPPLDPMEQRKQIIASRNRVLALVLFGLVVLFFAISIAKMS
ncbi:MAG: hypothetical protein ACK4YM_03765 [Novosphingobium sp.]